MHYVYILESVAVPGHFYIGSTNNLRQRFRQHQADVDAHAANYRPWKPRDRQRLLAVAINHPWPLLTDVLQILG